MSLNMPNFEMKSSSRSWIRNSSQEISSLWNTQISLSDTSNHFIILLNQDHVIHISCLIMHSIKYENDRWLFITFIQCISYLASYIILTVSVWFIRSYLIVVWPRLKVSRKPFYENSLRTFTLCSKNFPRACWHLMT